MELAKEFGATHTINAGTEDVKAQLMKITDQDGLDSGLDCSGNVSVIDTMIASIGPGGTAVTVGNPPHGSIASVEIFPFILGCKTYTASHQGNSYSKTASDLSLAKMA